MGNQNVTQWTFENVLFLDPDRLFSSSDRPGDAVTSKANSSSRASKSDTNESKPKSIRRNIPNQRTLQMRFFPITLTLNNCTAELYVQCTNQPRVALCLYDREKNLLRDIAINDIQDITRHKLLVKCTFKQTENQADQSQIVLQFYNGDDVQNFVEIVKLMFGIYVTTYGVTKQEEKEDETKEFQMPETSERCYIHGLSSCKCNLKAKRLSVQNQKEAHLSTDFPISIVGKLESGNTLSWNDLAKNVKESTGLIVVWRVSVFMGSEPEFLDEFSNNSQLIFYEDSLKLTNMMVGKYIQVKVTRGFQSKKHNIIYSLAQRGPITVNDFEAESILEVYCGKKTLSYEISVSDANILWPNELESQLNYLAPFYKGSLKLTANGLHLSLPIFEKVYESLIPYKTFYTERQFSKDENFEEDLLLYLHLNNKEASPCKVILPNYDERNALYHAIYLFKLQPNLQYQDIWLKCLKSGSYSEFKNTFAKLWENTHYSDITLGLH